MGFEIGWMDGRIDRIFDGKIMSGWIWWCRYGAGAEESES